MGRNGFYQKEGVVDREGNLRVSFGFAAWRSLVTLEGGVYAEGQGLDHNRMEATWEATRMSWACIWKEG